MLETSFQSNAGELTYAGPGFEWLLLRACGFDAMFRIMTVHGADLLYHTPVTGQEQIFILCSRGLSELLLAKLHSSRLVVI